MNDFNKSWKEIKEIYKDLESIVEANERLFIMPKGLYERILKRVGHMEDRIRSQTESLKMHLKEKQELSRKLKKLLIM